MRYSWILKRHVILIVTVAFGLLSFASAASAEPMEAEYERLVKRAAAADKPNLGLAWLKAANRIQLYVPRPKVLSVLETYEKTTRDPLVRFELVSALTETRHQLRDFSDGYDGMKGPLGQQGCLINWEVVGPFANDNMEGFDTQFGPETATPGPFDGTLSQVDWRALPRHDRNCVFPVSSAIQPSTPAVAYLSTRIDSPRSQRARLLVGANGAYKAWLNGSPVAYRKEDQGLGVDSDAWELKLKRGENILVIKLASTADGALGFIARVTDSRLKPLNLSSRAARPAVALASAEAMTPTAQGVLARIEADAKTLQGDDAIWNAWLYKNMAWQNVATPWRDVAEKVLESPEKLSPRVQTLAAELYEEYWRRTEIIESAFARDFKDPWVAMALAESLSESIGETDILRSRAMKDALIKKNPEFLLAYTRLADWLSSRGFEEEAFRVLQSYPAKDRMVTPAYFNRYVSYVEDHGPIEDVALLKEKGIGFSAVTGAYWWAVINQHVAKGQVSEALELVREYRKIVPASQFAARKEAQILRAQDKYEDALGVIDGLITQTPGDASLYQTRADLLVAQGRVEDAVQALEFALVQRPQDQQIRDYLSHLRPDELRFWEDWMVEDVRALAEKYAPGPFDYDAVLDQTIVYVSPNGLAQEVNQRVDRVIKPEAVDSASTQRIAFSMGEERVDVLRVRVHKADGSISEDFDQWESGGARKGSTTYNDTAYVTVRANNVKPGDLVEVRWRLSQIANQNFRGDYFGDIAYLQGSRPIGFSRYGVIYPDAWELHFRPPSLEHTRAEAVPGNRPTPQGFKVTTFEIENVPHVESDPAQPGATDVYDYILVSNKRTYDEIGAWWWNLVEEQLIVDDTIRAKVNELVKGKTTDDAKVRAIHNYVVKNTRYLHVGLGIHGWKPYRTTTAFRNRYGDCKDKAALLKVMLEEAGIPANLVLVRTRRLGKVDAFPASMHVFNHAITYVPGMDLYLDGTAEFNGTRELTSMDQGAQALIVKDGGKAAFLELPVDKPEANRMRTELVVDLTGDEPVTRGTLTAYGANAVWLRTSLQDPERRDEVLEKTLASDYPGAKLVSAKYYNLDDLEAPTKITFSFTGGQLVRGDGTRSYLLAMAQDKDLIGAYAKQSKRTQDMTIRVPFMNETQVSYRISSKKKYEKVPPARELKSKFGAMKVDYTQDGDSLVVSVRYSIDMQRIPVAEYGEFRSFLSKVTDTLNETIGLSEER